jgi:hypothetical protein
MGTAELKAQFGPKKHELSVSTYQMCILLLFNNAPQITFKEIMDSTAIPIPDLKRNLLTLSSSKYRVLLHKSKKAAGGDDEKPKKSEDGEEAAAEKVRVHHRPARKCRDSDVSYLDCRRFGRGIHFYLQREVPLQVVPSQGNARSAEGDRARAC